MKKKRGGRGKRFAFAFQKQLAGVGWELGVRGKGLLPTTLVIQVTLCTSRQRSRL